VAAETEGTAASYVSRLDIVQQMRWYSFGLMATRHFLRLEFGSAFDMLDLVQGVSDQMCREVGLDDEAVHWVGVAIRESVINAIKHGNLNDAAKHVFVEFDGSSRNDTAELTVRVRDQGQGFDPGILADPLAPENLLKPSGRGIFLIRSFMDDVQLRRPPEGGMEIMMTKRVRSADAPETPVKA
jgi:serine/threonine-protein kinase RsbW